MGPYRRSRDLRIIVGTWVAIILIVLICVI